MKPAVFLFQPLTEGEKWQQALQRLGTEPGQIRDPEGILSLCRSGMAGLLFADQKLISASLPALGTSVAMWTNKGGTIVLTGTPDATSFPFPVEILGECRDPLIVNDVLLRYIPDYSRRFPRLDTRLPGLVSIGKSHLLCEILSIGPGGAFIKTGVTLPETGTTVRITIALLGMRKEVELEATVVRHVIPNEYNNYQQGFGVCFIATDPALLADLCAYMKNTVCDADAPLSYSPAFRPTPVDVDETAPTAVTGASTPNKSRSYEKNLTRIR